MKKNKKKLVSSGKKEIEAARMLIEKYEGLTGDGANLKNINKELKRLNTLVKKPISKGVSEREYEFIQNIWKEEIKILEESKKSLLKEDEV
jgi:hypothetical protein